MIEIAAKPMTKEEILYRALEEHVNPDTFDGGDACYCLIGQLANVVDPQMKYGCCDAVAHHYGVSMRTVDFIFGEAAIYNKDYEDAMQMARIQLEGEYNNS